MSQRIFHYTNSQGLVGIISGQAIWLSDYRCMNDRSEIEYAFSVIKEAINEIRDGTTKPLLDASNWEKALAHDRADPIMIGSFSTTADNPVLWRLYSKGKGYVIGIDRTALEGAIRNLPNARFGHVIYNRRKQIDFVQEKLREFLESRSITLEQIDNQNHGELVRHFNQINFYFWLYQVAPFVKSEAFEHELEWRISAHVRNNRSLKFRVRDEEIVPYLDLQIVSDVGDPRQRGHSWLKSIDMGSQIEYIRVMPQIYALLDTVRIDPKKVDFFQNKFPI